MRVSLRKYWDRLRSSFWFLPAIMAVGAVVLACSTVALDEAVARRGLDVPGWIYSGGPQGASTVLGTIAGSMITIAGVVFSLTLVALSIASSQLGPRLLQNVMRDTTNQVVLGTFVATFLYCLLVLRTIRRDVEATFVPHVSVSLGVLFAVVSLAVLIYFIHHVALSIQADEVIARVCADAFDGIDRLFPAQIGRGGSPQGPAPADLPQGFPSDARLVEGVGEGYLQFIDAEALLALAAEEDVILQVERRPGQYVMAGSPLVLVWPGHRAGKRLTEQINGAFVLGNQRTPAQDVEFSVNQLVEIAVRALSPGVNDPFTAITCVDRLGAVLSRVARRAVPSTYRRDGHGRLRVMTPSITFAGIADGALDEIRRYARTSAAVTIRLLETIESVARSIRRPEDRIELERHAEMITRGARTALAEEADRRAVEARFLAARLALRQSPEVADAPDPVSPSPRRPGTALVNPSGHESVRP